MDWTKLLEDTPLVTWVRVAAIVTVGAIVLRAVSGRVSRTAQARWNAQTSMLLRRTIGLVGWSLIAATALRELGFELGVLLGAAGVLTVAVGFASQTAASNLISGLFLVGERPFVLGDVITVDTVTGEVISIDLVSVKLRTFDNLVVRLPNEMMLKSRITNLTHFEIRRMDLQLGVAYGSDMDQVITVLRDVAERLPLCLDEPEPLVIHQGFGDSAILLQFSVWASRHSFLKARNELYLEIKRAFDAAGIEIPFPQRDLWLRATPDGGSTPPSPPPP